ncbi:GH1 family beta-glucosidase [Caldanaerobacter subterraneus]|uniref:beta-glucosidase n=1 Tax=Caldanaerobacter subterraneus TaxID=911092 RepID=A0A4R2K1V8_9THEO|nr:GH1 family beta-glucosidase [Caldanaerobacter subterraneus]MBE3578432.1 beta-glucosidase [Caldanaerobacter subterraneus]MCS3916860.1 beta-glucosidase [Caldanaerobacter subterraneus subsp. tengcongensis MB4]TCO66344.1 broad-specificity cellobiase [Caldanaerobacter subterraneus]
MVKFPKDFTWGVATSSYQIEGAVNEDGRTPSIWDTFSKTEGKTYQGHTGDVACDHYHRYKEDVQIMKEIGVKAYRFSIAWPRIFPEEGKYNPKGMDFYKRLVDELLKREIIPVATIYHWDLPQWAYEKNGGWLNRESVKWYVEYASKLFEELGDVIPLWITHNEPWCSSILSYGIGEHAPGHKDWREALIAAHHILLSHGEAVKVFRDMNLKGAQIGITLNLTPAYPASEKEEDKLAVQYADGFANRWFLDPIFKGNYPEDMMELYSKIIGEFDFIREGDLETISVPIDFLGVNYYTRSIVKYNEDSMLKAENVPGPGKKTEMGWEISPESLYDLLKRLDREYTKLPMYITENGVAFKDEVTEDGRVHDYERIEYIKEHLKAIARFIEEGGNLKGYFVWSLLDNFEWAHGYSKRFGIVYVDYETQKRILKDSAFWYKGVIEKGVIE